MEVDVGDLLGMPYKDRGRGDGGYDCYGLALEVERRFGTELPDPAYEREAPGLFERKCGEVMSSGGRALRVREPVEGAMILFEDGAGVKDHIGVYMGGGMYVHCDHRGVRMDRLRRGSRVAGYYIWQG